MKYALLMYAAPDAPAYGQKPADDRAFADWESYTRALKDAGVVLGAEQLRPADTTTSVRWRGGERERALAAAAHQRDRVHLTQQRGGALVRLCRRVEHVRRPPVH